jgi:tetratricopeptide (TPR) repeat protein
MAKRKRKTTRKKNEQSEDVQSPEDRGLFAEGTQEDVSEPDVFAADQTPADSATHADEPTLDDILYDQGAPSLGPVQNSRFSKFQKVLMISIVFVAIALLFGLLRPFSGLAASHRRPSPKPDTPSGTRLAATQQVPEPGPLSESDEEEFEAEHADATFSFTEPLSLKVAECFYLKHEYEKAYAAYERLLRNLPSGDEHRSMADFLRLKIALCLKKAGDTEPAYRLLRKLLTSRVPIVGAIAAYQQGLLEIEERQYLRARSTAYRTIALVEALDCNNDWVLSLERQCRFLVAESMTRNVLSLCDADRGFPPELWRHDWQDDPFIDLSHMQIRRLLKSGAQRLQNALLGPQIHKQEQADAASRWSVVCYGAPIEELLARFATSANFDVHWAEQEKPSQKTVQTALRDRPVYLYMRAATPYEFVTTATGCVGLLAQFSDNRTIEICNPSEYSSLSDHVDKLADEAAALWQRFLLTAVDDNNLPNAHFALAMLQAQRGQVNEAVAEYKLVANRFSQSRLAAHALLQSSKLKIKLRDYVGARQDLKQLIELYPDSEFSDQACLFLADATLKAGMFEEAARHYKKVYNLAFSLDSRIASALGAGKCFYESQDYEAATKWLDRYVSLAQDQQSQEFSSACFVLGKAYLTLGKHQQACGVLERALDGHLSKKEYVETTTTLVETYIGREHFTKALGVLESARKQQFSQSESVKILVLRARALESIGLTGKAEAVLSDRAQYVLDPKLKAEIFFELARCHMAKGELEFARDKLTRILTLVEPGPFAQEVQYELAALCLDLGQHAQALSICSQLLESKPVETVKQKALGLMARAHAREQDYNSAILALLGRPNGTVKQGAKALPGNKEPKTQTPSKSATQ